MHTTVQSQRYWSPSCVAEHFHRSLQICDLEKEIFPEELPVNHKYLQYILTICLESLEETEGVREKEIIGGDNKK